MSGAYLKIRGLESNLDAMARVPAILADVSHLRKSAPHFVSAIKRNFDAGGRPAGWPPKKSGGACHLTASGRLRGSIKDRVSGDELRIGPSGLPYAAIHHFGGRAGIRHTAKIPARPYLVLPEDEKETGRKIVAESMQKAIDQL